MVKKHNGEALVELAGYLVVAGAVFAGCLWLTGRLDLSIIGSAFVVAGGIKGAVMTRNHEKRKQNPGRPRGEG